jgi:hypothetical protein
MQPSETPGNLESLQKVVARDEPVFSLSHHSLLMLSTCSYLAKLLAVNERLPLKPMPLLIVVQRLNFVIPLTLLPYVF